jgi:UDPglucose--hexose-1-phosphate uridylyltransferase
MELRRDYILDRWVIIAPGRGKRPHEFRATETKSQVDPKTCIFCPGNESMTPDEKGRLTDDSGKWVMRWFANKFAFVDRMGNPQIRTDNHFFTYSDAYGTHEVVVETNDHNKQLWDLSEDELRNVITVYSNRIDELINEPYIKYVDVFKNAGPEAGTSIEHSHSQIVSLNTVPPDVQKKVDAMKGHASCPYCSIINIEKTSDRRVFENESFVVFTPYASRFNYEVWIYPKNHYRTLRDLSEDDLGRLASALKFVLEKMKLLHPAFNMAVYYAPKDADLHMHFEIYPRIAKWAGFELETGIIVNKIAPEDAAKFYRGEE